MIEQLPIEIYIFNPNVIDGSILLIVKYRKLERGVFWGKRGVVININTKYFMLLLKIKDELEHYLEDREYRVLLCCSPKEIPVTMSNC